MLRDIFEIGQLRGGYSRMAVFFDKEPGVCTFAEGRITQHEHGFCAVSDNVQPLIQQVSWDPVCGILAMIGLGRNAPGPTL